MESTIIQHKGSTKYFLRSVTQEFAETKRNYLDDQSCQRHTVGGVPEDLLTDIFSLIYYFLRYEQFH